MADTQMKEYLIKQLRGFKKNILDKEHPNWDEQDEQNALFIDNKPFYSEGFKEVTYTHNDFLTMKEMDDIYTERGVD